MIFGFQTGLLAFIADLLSRQSTPARGAARGKTRGAKGSRWLSRRSDAEWSSRRCFSPALSYSPGREPMPSHTASLPGDTLASIAEKYYGRIQYERLLVAANFFDARGGTPIVRGMRLEVPALEHRKVSHGDTWETLAADLLGSPSRADVLSIANGSNPWLAPEEGSEIEVPYNLRVVVGEGEQIAQVAYRHLGDMNKAWMLDRYNGLEGRSSRGTTWCSFRSPICRSRPPGARRSRVAGATCSEAGGLGKKTQRRIAQELPALVADVRAGPLRRSRDPRYPFRRDRHAHRAPARARPSEARGGLRRSRRGGSRHGLVRRVAKARPCRTTRPRAPQPKIIAACEHARRDPRVRTRLDWGALAPLRLRARGAAEGAWSGAHRSVRKGAGVEFAGHRAYVPGDDLRFIDRHALMRHGALMLREFETETDRSVYLVIDASSSMGFRGGRAPGAKLAFAAVLAAALSGSPSAAATAWRSIGSEANGRLSRRASGNEAFERLLRALEARCRFRQRRDERARRVARFESSDAPVVARSASSSATFWTCRDGAPERLRALSSKGRALVVVQTLDPDELELPYDGPVRLQSLEGVWSSTPTRRAYAKRTSRRSGLEQTYREMLVSRGAALVSLSTADEPAQAVRRILRSLESGGAMSFLVDGRARSGRHSSRCRPSPTSFGAGARGRCRFRRRARSGRSHARAPRAAPRRQAAALRASARHLVLSIVGATPFVQCSRLSFSRGSGGSLAVGLVLDDSLSMRAKLPNGEPRWKRAHDAARELLARRGRATPSRSSSPASPPALRSDATTNLALARRRSRRASTRAIARRIARRRRARAECALGRRRSDRDASSC